MSNIFLYLRRYIGVERYFIPLLDQDLLLRRKGKMLKVDAILLEQILEVNAAHKAAVFLGNSIFVKIGRSLTDEPLQFIVQCIRASLHRIECRRIMKQRALFCGQGMTVRHMVRNDFLDSFRRMRRVDLADSGHCNPFLPRW